METIPDGASISTSDPTAQIQQEVGKNQGQVIAQMVGGLAIGQLTVYLSQLSQTTSTEAQSSSPEALQLGANPYKGLLAFQETDGDRFFGREAQIEDLWNRFRHLHESESAVRVLPIYGPSGSGKSSLARAGLIPALGKRTLPGRDQARLVVLVPGSHPLEALATVLARMVTNDLTPVAKTREFTDELLRRNSTQEYDGLRRIADVLPDIAVSPLIILVDQFEEVYTLCTDQAERDAFVESLLCAASDRSKRVSVILTLRSDFLGETQQHPRLNKLFSSQGFLVPIMQPEELEVAISKPAEQAGYKLDRAIVKLLVEQAQGREGSLPLLQFALTRIWEGLQTGVDPADTLERIGGVGGALAGEAQRLYETLSQTDQEIARCIFLALVQVGEDSEGTRRRAALEELIPSDSDGKQVREIIQRFSQPGVWIIETSFDEQHGEIIEVAHEALIRNWEQLKEWLKECREALRKKRKIEQLTDDWKQQGKPNGYLLQNRPLRDAKEFMQAHKDNSETALSSLATEFVKASLRKQRRGYLATSGILILPAVFTLMPLHFWFVNKAKNLLYSEEKCKPNLEAKFLTEYVVRFGFRDHFRGVDLCNETLKGVRFEQVDLSGGNLQRANLSNANFIEAVLEETNFQDAFLGETNFQRAFIEDANFQGATLELGNFQGAYLGGANLQDANLREANLQSSYFAKANFLNANLAGANLEGANLEGAINLTLEQINQARICPSTKMPNYINRSAIDIKKVC